MRPCAGVHLHAFLRLRPRHCMPRVLCASCVLCAVRCAPWCAVCARLFLGRVVCTCAVLCVYARPGVCLRCSLVVCACCAPLPLLSVLPLLRPGAALPLLPRPAPLPLFDPPLCSLCLCSQYRPGAQCILCILCSTLPRPGASWRCSPPALLPLLCRGPELPGTAPNLAAYGAGAPHAALLYASVTIISYA